MSSTHGTYPRKAHLIAAFVLTCATLFPSLASAQLIVYVARHGQTEWNREGRIQGSTDNPLNAAGREQATALGALLANIKIDAVYVTRCSALVKQQ